MKERWPVFNRCWNGSVLRADVKKLQSSEQVIYELCKFFCWIAKVESVKNIGLMWTTAKSCEGGIFRYFFKVILKFIDSHVKNEP